MAHPDNSSRTAEGVLTLLGLPGVGPRTASLLAHEFATLDDEVLAPGLDEDRLHVGDLQGRPAAACGLLRPDSRFGQGQRGGGQACESQDTPSRRLRSVHARLAPGWVPPQTLQRTA